MSALNGDLLAPIRGDNPAGRLLRYDPIYEQIREARREDDDLPQGDWQTTRKSADWKQVITLATDALTKKTKDLQIAAWLTEAWLRREGFTGLRRGLQLLYELMQQYWDTIYPEIEDGDTDVRAAPLAWVGLKLELPAQLVPLDAEGHSLIDHRLSHEVPSRDEADKNSTKAEEREAKIADGRVPPEDIERGFHATPKEWLRALVADIDGSMELLDQLDAYCNERFTDPPAFLALRTALRDNRHLAGQLLARKLDLDPDPVGVELAVAAATSPAAGGATAAPVNVAAGPRDAREAGIWVAAAARKLRQDDPASPAPYLLLRSLRWAELRAGGGRIDPRLLEAPATEVRTTLKGLLLDAAWPRLLHECEEAMAQPWGRGWLDLQRYTLTAVNGLGDGYQAVDSAIRGALRTLLADLPELVSQTLMDDSPTANAETRAWLQEEHLLPDGTELEQAPMQSLSSAMQRDVWDVALARVRAGDARAAMELLMREATREKSARARFLRRAQAAEIMVGAGMEPVAMPLLRELLTLIDNHRLDEWEAGDTIAQPLALLYRCARRLGNGDVDADELYERICRLDPMRAVQLQTVETSGNEAG